MIETEASLLPPFYAQWKSLPASLRPPVLTTAQKVWRILWNILSVLIPIIGLTRLAAYGAAVLSRRLLLPAAYYSAEFKEMWEQQFQCICRFRSSDFEVVPTQVVTPDGAALSTTLFRHRKGNEATPVVIDFQGNASLKGMGSWDWILQDSIDKNIPVNLVVFDYRSVGKSTGTFTRPKDLVVDGSSIVDWIRTVMKTPDDRINLYGMSLGGAVAVKTMAADERLTGWIVNERSFSSLETLIRAWASHLSWFLKPLVPIVIWTLKNQDLELDAAADMEKLKARKLVVYHAADPVVLYRGSMARKFPQHAFQLQGGCNIDNHHCAGLENYDGARERVSKFMLNR